MVRLALGGLLATLMRPAPKRRLVDPHHLAIATLMMGLSTGPCAWAESEGSLAVIEPEGALVYVDGFFAGEVPAEVPATSGAHRVELFDGGHEPLSTVVVLEPNRRTEVAVRLAPTGQRIAAAVLLSVGGAGMLGGIGLGAWSLSRPEPEDNLGVPRTPDADEVRTGAAVSAGLGAGLFAIGAGLFLFDAPTLPDGEATLRLGPTGLACTVSF